MNKIFNKARIYANSLEADSEIFLFYKITSHSPILIPETNEIFLFIKLLLNYLGSQISIA
jgi:hypothetical protein